MKFIDNKIIYKVINEHCLKLNINKPYETDVYFFFVTGILHIHYLNDMIEARFKI